MSDAEHDTAGIVSVTSLLRTVGRLGRPSGRGLLMFRTLVVSSTTAAMVGLFAGYIGGAYLVTAVLLPSLILADDRHPGSRRRKLLRSGLLYRLCDFINLLLQKSDPTGVSRL